MAAKFIPAFILSLTFTAAASAQAFTSDAVSGANPRPQAVSVPTGITQAVSGANPRPQSVSTPTTTSGDVSAWTVLLTVLGL